ncbi:MAG: IS30 family transposase [Balneolaceae bacterium]|nr:IS30 family transposase [Balneolaceae bacterium]
MKARRATRIALEQPNSLPTQRHRDKPKHRRFTDALKAQARQWLTVEKLSPELISGRWGVMGIDGVSHETLYQWIWTAKRNKDPTDKDLYKHLKHGARKAKRGNRQDSRGRIKGRVSIEQRPEVVEKRQRLGDIEVDLMMGKAHKSALLVLTDRTTLLTALEKVTSRKAEGIADRITQRLGRIPPAFIKTLTFDNDKAFARHQDIAKDLKANTYFTRPYTSQDKGTVENRIWVLRRFFPKGTDLRKVSEERIKTVEEYLNFRPIRKFDYLNPIQQSLNHRAVALIT